MSHRCRGAGILLVLVAAALPGLSRAASADDATYRHYLDRATRILQEAEAYRRLERWDLAKDRARRAAALIAQADRERRGDARAAFLGVQAAVFAEDGPAARRWMDLYAQRTPYGEQDPNLHYGRAMVHLFLDDRPADAVASLDRMAQLSPRGLTRPANELLYRALTAHGGRLADARRVDAAVRQFKRASRVARRLGDVPKDVAARGNGAITLLESGRADDAEKLLARLHAQQPGNPLFAYYLGRSLRHLERFAEAVALLERVAALVDAGGVSARHAGRLRAAHLELGIALRGTVRRAEDDAEREAALLRARRAFERYAELEPGSAEAWHRLGRLLAVDLDRPHEAIAPLERAHALDPVCDGALRLLLRIAGGHGPPAGTTDGAWRARRGAWARELETNAERWKAERERRRRASRSGTDDCP